MGAQAASAASICCHVERLPRQQLSVAAAPASGPRSGLAPDESFEENYQVLESGSELDQSTWVHTKAVRAHDVKGAHTELLYTCIRIQKSASPLQEQGLEKHLKVLCRISHPHLCKVVECFNAGDERILICEKPPSERFFEETSDARPWTRLEGREKQSAGDASQLRKDELVIAELLRQILSGLAHGHAQGCVHGMLTPDKVRLQKAPKKSSSRRTPQIKVLGFGLGYVLVPPLGYFLFKELSKERRGPDALQGLPYTAVDSITSKEQFLALMRTARGGENLVADLSQATPRLSVQPGSGPPEEVKLRVQQDLHLIDSHLRGLAPPGAEKADVWAVGALAYRLLTGVSPFLPMEGSKKDILGQMQTEPVKFLKKDWSKRSSKCSDAVQCMLRVTSSLRPSAADMLRHPWLKLPREPVPLVRMHRFFANGLNYLKEPQFKKLIIRVVAQQLSETESHLEQANAIFRALDRDRDGLLSPKEFMEGLYLFPDLVQRLGEDPERLFEAADRDGSGFLDSQEFAACTLPPAKSREEEVIWYAFQAFDEDKEQVVTIDKVLFTARLVEGQLCSNEQIEELVSVLQAELQRVRVPLKLEKPKALEESVGSVSDEEGVSERLHVEGETDEDDESMEEGLVPARGSTRESGARLTMKSGSLMDTGTSTSRLPPPKDKDKEKNKQAMWIQRKWQGVVEKLRRWVTRPRPLDFGEFLFLCDTRRKGIGPGKLFYRVLRKEAFRVLLKHDLDFYEVLHKVAEFDWPPAAGSNAKTPNSCHFSSGGLCKRLAAPQASRESTKKEADSD